MSDRGVAFLLSLLMVLLSLGGIAWVIATGQLLSLDGLFLIATALVLMAGFGIYMAWLVREAMKEGEAPALAQAKPAPARAATASAPPSGR